MLPNEEREAGELWGRIHAEYTAAERLHNVVIELFFAGQLTLHRVRPGLSMSVVDTLMALLPKLCKTHRALEVVAKRGLGEDAMVLARSMFECSMAILFILEKDSIHRAAMYHSHCITKLLVMLEQWEKHNIASDETRDGIPKVQDALEVWTKSLREGVNVRRHWSGTGSLEEALQGLGHGHMYRRSRRPTSAPTSSRD